MRRSRSNLSAQEIDTFKDATHLFYLNDKVDNHNTGKLLELANPIARLTATNSSAAARKLSSENFSGMANIVHLSVGSKVIITANLWKQVGINNGADGTIVDIVYYNNNQLLPDVIVIDVPEYCGPPFFTGEGREKYVPLPPSKVMSEDKRFSRTGFSIRLAYALTIHKSQGQSMTKSVVDLGDAERTPGLSYVAISRITHFMNMMLEPCSYDRLEKIAKSKSLEKRKKEEQRLDVVCQASMEKHRHIME